MISRSDIELDTPYRPVNKVRFNNEAVAHISDGRIPYSRFFLS